MFNKTILVSLLCLLLAPATASAASLKLVSSTPDPVAGSKVAGLAKGASYRKCSLKASGKKLKLSPARKAASWSFIPKSSGFHALKLKCGKKSASLKIKVAAKTEAPQQEEPVDPPVEEPVEPPVDTPAPRLVGSDAEAENYWQWSKGQFEKVDSRGFCGDYAFFKRPDIPELVTKTAYKEWVAQGTPALNRQGEWFSANSLAEPAPHYFINWHMMNVSWGPDRTITGANDAYTTWARKAGFKVQQTPFPGAIMVYTNHVRYIESVEPGDSYSRQGYFSYTEMNAKDPKKVFSGSEGVDINQYQSNDIWFVG